MGKDRSLVEGTGDHAVSAVLGAVMMLALMMTLVPGAMMLRAAVSDEMTAHREAAERAAWCARHVEIGPPDCPDRGPMPGYECVEAELGVWVCSRPPTVPLTTPTPPTVTPPAITPPTVTPPAITPPPATTPDLGL